jgi:hypothetical protein
MSAKTLGTLTTTPDLTCVTWKDAKRQVRAAVRANNMKAVGFFRPRKANRGVLLLGVEGGTVTATRKPGADIVFSAVEAKTADKLSASELAAILAQG